MKWICFIFMLLPLNAQANLLERSLSSDISIIEFRSGEDSKDTIGLYNVNIEYKSNSFGLLKKFKLGGNWNAGLGLLFGKDTLKVTTTASPYLIFGKSIDINKTLGVEMDVEFYPAVPIASIGYQNLSPKKDFIFNINAGFRLLKIKKGRITFNQDMGKFLESHLENIDEYKEEALNDLGDYYPNPVINLSMTFFF